ncbi:Protein Aster-A [Kappamyces sp. JEL0829]|nr:Protein Aster-A [Kappamyces sp. JEL0829]
MPRVDIPRQEEKQELIVEWKRIFGKSLVEGERLVWVFRCALAKPTLMEGTLPAAHTGKFWLSDYHICFKLNWPSQTQVIIPIHEIVDIRKSSFANIVPNALEIETLAENYFFGSMTGRGEKYSTLVHIWDQLVQPTSLARKFPDLSATKCVCEIGTCDYCEKVYQVKQAISKKKKKEREAAEAHSSINDAVDAKIPSSPPSSDGQSSFLALDNSSSLSLARLVDDVQKEKEMEQAFSDGLSSSSASPQNRGSLSLPNSPSKDSIDTLGQPSSECTCDSLAGYDKVYEGTIPFSLETIWKEWFCAPAGGNAFVRFLMGPQDITEVEIAPWAKNGDKAGEDCVPLDNVGGGDFEPAFSSIKPGMYKKTSRLLPLKHGIPFIPKSTPGLDTYTVLHVDANELCIKDEANIVLMGILTNVNVCLKQVAPNQCQMKVYMELIFTGKGKINAPRALAEKSTIDGVKSFYRDIVSFFEKEIDNTDLESVACNCDQLAKENQWDCIYTSDVLPISIAEFWKDVFAVASTGNAFTRFVHEYAGWKVPGAVPAFTQQSVVASDGHTVCVHSASRIPDFGIETQVRLCVKSLGSQRTQVKVLGAVAQSSGKYPPPNNWKDASKTVASFYRTLFGDYLIPAKDPQALGIHASASKSLLSKGSYFLGKLVPQTSTAFIHAILVFLFAMLLVNTLILWNLVAAAERSHSHIGQLQREIEMLKKNNQFNANRDKKKSPHKNSLQSKQGASGRWSHDAYKAEQDQDDGMEMDDDMDAASSSPAGPWLVSITNLHWNVSEADLKELFGNGKSDAVFKSKALALEAQKQFHGESLDGRELQLELKGPYKRPQSKTKPQSAFRSGKSIESRLGPATNVFSRLAPKLDDRLGKKIEDRLGKKRAALVVKKNKTKAMDVDRATGAAREIKSYADVQVTNDGTML